MSATTSRKIEVLVEESSRGRGILKAQEHLDMATQATPGRVNESSPCSIFSLSSEHTYNCEGEKIGGRSEEQLCFGAVRGEVINAGDLLVEIMMVKRAASPIISIWRHSEDALVLN